MDKNLCLPSGACSHRCKSGKDCEGSRRASCMALGLHRLVQVDGGESVDARACTCHPDDNPPKPCPRKFALNECRAATRAIDYLMAGLVVFFVLGLVFSVFK